MYSYKWENLTKAEQNQCLHESYQFLVKKYIPKAERKKLKEASEGKKSNVGPHQRTGSQKKTKKGKEKEETTEIEPEEEEEVKPWNGEIIPDVIDSVLDFSHLR